MCIIDLCLWRFVISEGAPRWSVVVLTMNHNVSSLIPAGTFCTIILSLSVPLSSLCCRKALNTLKTACVASFFCKGCIWERCFCGCHMSWNSIFGHCQNSFFLLICSCATKHTFGFIPQRQMQLIYLFRFLWLHLLVQYVTLLMLSCIKVLQFAASLHASRLVWSLFGVSFTH